MRLLVQTRGVEIGGNETALRHLLDGFRNRNWQTRVVVPPGPVERWFHQAGHSTQSPPTGGWGNFLRLVRPDRVLVTCVSGLFPLAPLCRQQGISVSWLYHAPQRQWLVEQNILELAFASVDHILAPSHYLKEELAPPPTVPVVVIPNGIGIPPCPTPTDRQEGRRLLGLEPDHFVLGYSARFETRKRHDLLLRAFGAFHRRHPSARLVLLGRNERHGLFPSTAESTWSLMEDLGLENAVHWVAAEPEEVPRFLALFDLFCFPPRREAQGCALLEAMSLGVPTLSANAEGIRELFSQGAPGWSVAPDDPAALEHGFDLAWRYRQDLPRWGEQGREWVREHHGLEKMQDEYCAHLLNPAGGAPLARH